MSTLFCCFCFYSIPSTTLLLVMVVCRRQPITAVSLSSFACH